MAQEDARRALDAAMTAIREAADTLRPHAKLFEAYRRERESMDSVGPIIDPTLWKNRERQDADAIVAPVFEGAQEFLRIVEAQRTRALESFIKSAGIEDV